MTQAEVTRRAREDLSAALGPEIAPLRRLRTRRRFGEIAVFTALWGVGIALGLRGLALHGLLAGVLRLGGIAFSAVALNAFFLLSHEGHHHLLFRRPAANHATNVLLCTSLFHAPTAYRVLHELHHRHLRGPGDPDEYRNFTSDRRLLWALQWMRLILSTFLYTPIIPVVAWRRAGSGDRWRIGAEYAGMACIWGLAFASIPLNVLLQTWVLPGIVVGYFSSIRALAQHALTGDEPLLASRSVCSGRLVSFLLLNENLHLEHHLFPEVPSYNLPHLRALLRPHLPRAVEDRSYTRFLAGFVARSLRGDDSVMGLTRPDAEAMP
ncbi:MAG TPA: fatty acid desaturase [Thermoanaerobaculia bacterium]